MGCREMLWRCGLDSHGKGQGPVVGFCEHGYEPSGSLRAVYSFLDQQSRYQLFKKDLAPKSRLVVSQYSNKCIFLWDSVLQPCLNHFEDRDSWKIS